MKNPLDKYPDIPKAPRGGRRGIKLSEKHKDQLAATALMNRVKAAAKGEIDMTPTQIRAAELYLSKTIPSLSAVEQTNLNPEDEMSQDQLLANLKMMLDNPVTKRLLKQLLEEETPNIQEVKAA